MPENDASTGDEKLLILPLGEESKRITQVISNDTARQIIELLADVPLSASDIAEHLHAPISTIVYNLENLEDVGLIRIDKIKYSEKGREVKIYAPVRKLIVVVPEKADRRSVVDMLRKYLGVIFAGASASGMIEFFMRKDRNAKFAQNTDGTLRVQYPASDLSANATSMPEGILSETIKDAGSYDTIDAMPTVTPVPADITESITPSEIPEPIVYAPPTTDILNDTTVTPATAYDAAERVTPDILTRIADTIVTHPGIMFFIGCLFVVTLLIIMDYHRKRKSR
ncbi:MAG: helix-turn-helix domain-containing protein [Candidatus Methanoperedens sp.]|nr:helix-turn-helix domain-containing protein [Candidatus Methanoperedens nitroreducens]MDJ1421627.1 helix-turn-helix domain-containing protein [Candidatus Methanoperedens sp.]